MICVCLCVSDCVGWIRVLLPRPWGSVSCRTASTPGFQSVGLVNSKQAARSPACHASVAYIVYIHTDDVAPEVCSCPARPTLVHAAALLPQAALPTGRALLAVLTPLLLLLADPALASRWGALTSGRRLCFALHPPGPLELATPHCLQSGSGHHMSLAVLERCSVEPAVWLATAMPGPQAAKSKAPWRYLVRRQQLSIHGNAQLPCPLGSDLPHIEAHLYMPGD